ncbi:hypothetical protein E3N88_02230 [Mikania micrantha]|uniref:PGG domain-containing protein n=1 Tax=Mikania micrantha TaxID=192012 RepID=A0A5N6Q382_9ASTR|nr:hypothetical protein E3N88_02230 [Mikania micrantha]
MMMLLGSSREDYLKYGVPLYEASIKYNWKAAKAILDTKTELVRYSITENGETSLHVAASAKGDSKRVEEFVKKMVEMMGEKDLELQNKNYDTALYLAAVTGNVETVKIMVKKNRKLLTIPGANRTMMPLYAAALFGNKDVVNYIYEESGVLSDEDGWSRDNRGWFIEKLVEIDMFVIKLQNVIHEHVENMTIKTNMLIASAEPSKALELQDFISQSLVRMHATTKHITKDSSDLSMQDNNPVSNKEHLALQLQKLIFKYIADLYDKTMKIISTSSNQKEDQLVQQLQNGIVEHNKKEAEDKVKRTYSSPVVFIAAEMGNTNFLVELIRGYPDLIWKVNDNNQSIFHVAVKHRHAGIYSLLYEIGTMKHMITPLRDDDENNMLHLVGICTKQNPLEGVSGVALQMQRELSWFQEVKKMVPPAYRLRKNKDGLTPHELFTKEHKELVTQGEKWMKETASQCIVVGALIATIVFAATFTVPGGYNQNNGIPFFRTKATFVVFVVADAISLILSSASILLFLSILTSRYDERDFLESLSLKLLFGLATLFLSIATMLIAFGVSFLPLYKKGLLWIPILICVLVALPAILYARLQYRLFVDVIRSTFLFSSLFKPRKRLIYYANPQVNHGKWRSNLVDRNDLWLNIAIVGQIMVSGPWQGWKDVPFHHRERMFERFQESWTTLVEAWNTTSWKGKSSINIDNRKKAKGGRHTLGSKSFVTVRHNLDKALKRRASFDEYWLQTHAKKGSRPLDRLEGYSGSVTDGSGEANDVEETVQEQNVTWVDSRARESYTRSLIWIYGYEPREAKKKGRLYGSSNSVDPYVVMAGASSMSGTGSSYPPSRNDEVQRLKEQIEQDKVEKQAMMEKIEENARLYAEMNDKLQLLLKSQQNLPPS